MSVQGKTVGSSHIFGEKGDPGSQNLAQNFHEGNAHNCFLDILLNLFAIVEAVCILCLCLAQQPEGSSTPPHNPCGPSSSISWRLGVFTRKLAWLTEWARPTGALGILSTCER